MANTQSAVVVGAGLAGCEVALWLAKHGASVQLYEQKPHVFSPAHKSENMAELVCSNSFKAERVDSAGGLLKAEMQLLGSGLLPLAEACRVPAGGALAVNRDAFAAAVTQCVAHTQNITVERSEATRFLQNEQITIIASGPLTQGALADEIARAAGGQQLAFYDAAAPIVMADSLCMDKVFAAARYNRGDADYVNCPFNKEEYETFHAALLAAEKAPLHQWDGPLQVYEGCMPIEVMAARGQDTMRYGPLRPVGLVDPRTGHRPWACVQLRKEDKDGTLYNMVGFQTNLKFGEQKRVFGLIPGLENAEFVRYGVMHRNTFLNSPEVLAQDLSLKTHDNVLFAGQITGFEGYMESAACGLLAARAAYAKMHGKRFTPPPATTMCGALLRYCTAPNGNFQPMGANMGLLPMLADAPRDKRLRYGQMAQRALQELQNWLQNEEEGR